MTVDIHIEVTLIIASRFYGFASRRYRTTIERISRWTERSCSFHDY